MTLEEMMRLGEEQARRVLIGTKEDLLPSWMLADGEGKVTIVATPWRNNDEKHMVAEVMREAMRGLRIDAYTVLIEVWLLRVKGPPPKEYKGPAPSDSPDREEAVILVGATRAGEHVHKHWITKRDAAGVCIALESMGDPETQLVSDIFDNLLVDKPEAN